MFMYMFYSKWWKYSAISYIGQCVIYIMLPHMSLLNVLKLQQIVTLISKLIFINCGQITKLMQTEIYDFSF